MTRITSAALAATLAALLPALPANATDPDPDNLETCGYHSLPLIMEQRPPSSPMYLKNFNAIDTVNDYLEIFQYSNFESGWGINGANEFGPLMTSSQLEDAWYWSWEDLGAIAVEMSTNWCGFGCCEKTESDLAFNASSTWTWVYEPSGVITDEHTWYYPRIALHELCHAWGIENESANYQFPTIMLPMAREAYPDERLIHGPDAWLLRWNYDDQISYPTHRNLVVVSKYVHPTKLRWRKTTHTASQPLSPGETFDIENLTIENTGTEDLTDVHVRFYLRPWGSDVQGQLIADFGWAGMMAMRWNATSYYDIEIPFYIETGTYEIRAFVTHNGYQPDDRAVDSWTGLVDPIEIIGRSLEVTAPSGGEDYRIGDTMEITWESDNIGDDEVWIYLSRQGGVNYSPLVKVPDTGSYTWTVSGPPSDDCVIRVTSAAYGLQLADFSGPFSIWGNYIEVEYPNGGEVLTPGSPSEIRWQAVYAGDLVDLDFNCIGGWMHATPNPVAADSGVLSWQVPDTTSTGCLVRVRSVDDPAVEDTSDQPFTIQPSFVEVEAPAEGDTVIVGEEAQVELDYHGTCSYLNVKLARSPNGPYQIVGQVLGTADAWPWLVLDPQTTWARFLLEDGCDPTSFGLSGVFSILRRRLTVESPNGGETWVAGTTETVTWSSIGAGSTVDISLLPSDPQYSEYTIAEGATNDGSWSYFVPPDWVGDSAWVRVRSVQYPDIEDFSDTPFTIAPALQVLSPNGGEHLVAGEERVLTWSTGFITDFVRLEYRESGGPWHPIVYMMANSGTWTWQVPQLANGTLIRWRVFLYDEPEIGDTSDEPIVIDAREISVYSPAGGEVFVPGTTASVRWNSNLAGSQVVVSESCDGGASWTQLAGPILNVGQAEILVAPPHRDECKVRVDSTLVPGLFGLSEGTYEVANSRPVAFDDELATIEDQRGGINPLHNDTDADGDELVLDNYSQPDHGQLTTGPRPGDLFYYPHADFHGEDSFIYRIGDQHGGLASGTVHITVAPVNDPPVAHDDALQVPAGYQSRLEVLANDVDVDGDPLIIIAMSSAQHGSVSQSGGVIIYTPQPGYTGSDSFQYSVADPSLATSSATVQLTVGGS